MFMVKCQAWFKEGYYNSTFIVLHRPPRSNSVWPTKQLDIYQGSSAGIACWETKGNLICKQQILNTGVCATMLSIKIDENLSDETESGCWNFL